MQVRLHRTLKPGKDVDGDPSLHGSFCAIYVMSDAA
jgi:hypothetical protein